MPTLPVIAAIPNYNMGAELAVLLPQLISQDYAAIFVLDDASTDNSRAVVKKFGDKATFIAGEVNKGAGGNRNRIIEALKYEALIHFLDADTLLETDNAVAVIHSIMPGGPVGFIGGLAKTKAGLQNIWNYGPGPGLRSEISAFIQYRIGKCLDTNPAKARRMRLRHARLLAAWPDPLTKPVRREVFWNIEQSLVIRSSVFKELGGFDERFRETEIMELAMRIRQAGLKNYFDPRLVTRHTEAQVRQYNRTLKKKLEGLQTARKYGLADWLLSKDIQ
jgi:GT2 family glycosyltransferase